MKRTGKIIVRIVTIESLLLAVVVAALWIRSYTKSDMIFSRAWTIGTYAGHLYCIRDEERPAEHFAELSGPQFTSVSVGRSEIRTMAEVATAFNEQHLGFSGFSYTTYNAGGPVTVQLIGVPLWFPLANFLLLPIWQGWRFVSQRWGRRPGTCRACGYILTPNVSGVCPECGVAIPEGLPA